MRTMSQAITLIYDKKTVSLNIYCTKKALINIGPARYCYN